MKLSPPLLAALAFVCAGGLSVAAGQTIARVVEDRSAEAVADQLRADGFGWTSVLADGRGAARVVGKGPVYVVVGDHRPEVCAPGAPLTYSNYKVWKIPSGATFELRRRPATGFYLVSVEKGKITSNPY